MVYIYRFLYLKIIAIYLYPKMEVSLLNIHKLKLREDTNLLLLYAPVSITFMAQDKQYFHKKNVLMQLIWINRSQSNMRDHFCRI
jgi:hypothetical protein